MDKQLLLRPEVQDFIRTHETDDLNALILQRKKYPDLPIEAIVGQIKSRTKAKSKLPTWYGTQGILYPEPVSIEQASSEITAKWKADYVGQGQSGLDLTGGFGVDSHYFAKSFTHWAHVDPNHALQQVVSHNAPLLGNHNTSFHNLKGEEYLAQLNQPVDFIYLDPDRRPGRHRATGFKDSTPDLTQLLNGLKRLSRRVLIKASPMIDITAGLADLEAVQRVIVLGVNNEVKEVLFHLDFVNFKQLEIRCVNITQNNIQTFSFFHKNHFQEEIKISSLRAYLFEPNATIMKAGGQDALAHEYGLAKLHRNTNLYTANEPVELFPGRVFKVIASLPYKKKALSPYLPEGQGNLSTRNFIDTPEQMKKKLGLKDGGRHYLFGYRNFENKNKVAVCEKI